MKMHHEAADAMAPRRRRLLFAAAACCLPGLRSAAGAHGVGIVDPPIALPAGLPVLCSDGKRRPLRDLLRGRQTMLHLMFTGCGETCPLQGALFAAIQARLPAWSNGKILLLSLSIDPMDDARSLANWLRRFNAGRAWIAAVPSARGIDVVRATLQDRRGAVPDHTSQVFFIDESGRLVWRTEELPSMATVVAIARHKRWIGQPR